jgi:choline kinase
MGDHIFEPSVLRHMLRDPASQIESLMAIDSRPAEPEVAYEATKVRLNGDRVTAIGKDVVPYDALDTGLFVCQPSVFAAAERACAAGDTTLSAGMRGLAADGHVRGIEIGEAAWWDVDTPEDLAIAEQLVKRPA